MHHPITNKSVKQSIQNLNDFFVTRGFDLPRHVLQEAFSRALFYKDWNTLHGVITSPERIENTKAQRHYVLELDCNLQGDKITDLIRSALATAKCIANVEEIRHKNSKFQAKLSFDNDATNFLTAMFLLAESVKTYNVKRFELMRVVVEKESMMAYFNQ